MESFNKLPTTMKILLVTCFIVLLIILSISIYSVISIGTLNTKIKKLDKKSEDEREMLTSKNANISSKLTSNNIDIYGELNANNINTSDKFKSNKIEVKDINISGAISSSDLSSKITEKSDIISRYLEVDLTDRRLYDKNKFYPLVFHPGTNSGQINIVEFTISSHSGGLSLTHPSSFERMIDQNIIKFTGQGGGWNADKSFAEIFYTFHTADIHRDVIGYSRPAKTFGFIVAPLSLMGPLIDIKTGRNIPINVCLYVRGCNKYYIRTNAKNVNLMDQGGRITDTNPGRDGSAGSFINILELKVIDGVDRLVDDTSKQIPLYNRNLILNSENLNPGLELFWNAISSDRGKFFFSEGTMNMELNGRPIS